LLKRRPSESRDPRLYIEDIRLSCQKIIRFTNGMSFKDFTTDDRTYDAVIRNLEIIGEAARNVPPEVKGQYPDIEWRATSALRNILAHEYFGILDEIIWDIVQNKVPSLEMLAGKVLLDLENSSR
jgi:uncharacterized protein with HEPN domain